MFQLGVEQSVKEFLIKKPRVSFLDLGFKILLVLYLYYEFVGSKENFLNTPATLIRDLLLLSPQTLFCVW